MPEIDGQQLREYESKSRVAKVLGISGPALDRWVMKYGGKKGGIRLADFGAYTRVNVSDVQRCFEFQGILPDVSDAPEAAGDDIELQEPCEARYLFIIYRDGRKLETWGKMPTQQEIESSFGAGHYRIVQIDTENNGVTVTAEVWDLKGAPRPDEVLNPYLQGIERLFSFQKTLTPATESGNGNTKLIEVMLTNQQTLINTLLPLAMGGGRRPGDGEDKFEKAISQIQMLRELGLLDQPATGRTTADLLMGLIEKGGDVLAVIGPQIMAKLGAPLPPAAPAHDPLPSDFSMQGLNNALAGGLQQPKQIQPGPAATSPVIGPAAPAQKIRPITPEAVRRLDAEAK